MMAKFRDSVVQSLPPEPVAATPESKPEPLRDRLIGDIIREFRDLPAEEVEKVLAYQREKGVRFGEAAIALGIADAEDVLKALSKQFNYPYVDSERKLASPELVALNQPFSFQAEAIRAIRSQVLMKAYSGRELARTAVAIVSPNIGDGKTFFSANLAASLAQLGGRTLVVDAALRGPRLHEVFKLPNNVGLSGVLSGRTEAQVIQHVPGVPSLFLLPAGITPPNPLELIERPTFDVLMRELASKFDHVIVDTPAAIMSSDALVVAAKCGAALLIGRKDRSRLTAMQDMVSSFNDSPARLLGVVMNEY